MNMSMQSVDEIDRVRDLERDVLGVLVLNPASLPEVATVLDTDNLDLFVEPFHAQVYKTLMLMHDSDIPIDAITLDGKLRHCPEQVEYDHQGGRAFLAQITGRNGCRATVVHYAKQIAEHGRKRKLHDIAARMKRDAGNGVNSSEICNDYIQRLERISIKDSSRPNPSDIAAMMSKSAPPMEYLFEGMVPLNTIVGIDARGGSGKGWLTQQLITSLCIGRTLVGQFKVNRSSKVLWMQSEDPEGVIHSRFDAIAHAYKLNEEDRDRIAQNLTLYPETAEPFNMKDGQGKTLPTPFYQWLKSEIRRIQPRLIVIDPRSHFFAGDENSNVEVGAFMNLMKKLTLVQYSL
jgi:archaellum biogenesis ATPase FlaH